MGEGLELFCTRPTFPRGFALIHQTKRLRTTKTKQIKHNQKAKREAGIEGAVVIMLKPHTRQLNTIDTTTMKQDRKENEKKKINK